MATTIKPTNPTEKKEVLPADPKETTTEAAVFVDRTVATVLRGQAQIRVSGLTEALRKLGSDFEQEQVSGQNMIELTFRLSDGTEKTAIMGDTHSIWLQHQRSEDQKVFVAMLIEETTEEGIELTLMGARKAERPPVKPMKTTSKTQKHYRKL